MNGELGEEVIQQIETDIGKDQEKDKESITPDSPDPNSEDEKKRKKHDSLFPSMDDIKDMILGSKHLIIAKSLCIGSLLLSYTFWLGEWGGG